MTNLLQQVCGGQQQVTILTGAVGDELIQETLHADDVTQAVSQVSAIHRCVPGFFGQLENVLQCPDLCRQISSCTCKYGLWTNQDTQGKPCPPSQTPGYLTASPTSFWGILTEKDDSSTQTACVILSHKTHTSSSSTEPISYFTIIVPYLFIHGYLPQLLLGSNNPPQPLLHYFSATTHQYCLPTTTHHLLIIIHLPSSNTTLLTITH